MSRRLAYFLFAAAIVLIIVVTLASYHAGLTWCPDCDGT